MDCVTVTGVSDAAVEEEYKVAQTENVLTSERQSNGAIDLRM